MAVPTIEEPRRLAGPGAEGLRRFLAVGRAPPVAPLPAATSPMTASMSNPFEAAPGGGACSATDRCRSDCRFDWGRPVVGTACAAAPPLTPAMTPAMSNPLRLNFAARQWTSSALSSSGECTTSTNSVLLDVIFACRMAANSLMVSPLASTSARQGRARVIFAVTSPTPKPPTPVWCRQSSIIGCAGSALSTVTSALLIVTLLKFWMAAHSFWGTLFRKKVTLLLSVVFITL